jgi:hypothetical protein
VPHTATHSDPSNSNPSGRLARRSADPSAPLFAYGSLQFPEVLEVLLGRVPPTKPAEAEGWRIIPLAGLVYPGLVRARATVTGLIIGELTDADWIVIDAFENPAYELNLMHLTDGSVAWAYTSPNDTEPADGTWDAAIFASRHLYDYVHRCIDWRARYSAPLDNTNTPGPT